MIPAWPQAGTDHMPTWAASRAFTEPSAAKNHRSKAWLSCAFSPATGAPWTTAATKRLSADQDRAGTQTHSL